MKVNIPESKESKLFKSYIAQKFFNACNSLVPQSEVKDFWLDTSLYPFVFFISDIFEKIKKEKNFKLVFTDTMDPQGYQLSNSKIIVLVSSDAKNLRNIFAKLEVITNKALKEHKVYWVIYQLILSDIRYFLACVSSKNLFI
jgi:hypothetical protein